MRWTKGGEMRQPDSPQTVRGAHGGLRRHRGRRAEWKRRSPHSTARWADIRQMIILPVPSPKDSKDSASSKGSQGRWAGAPRLRTIPIADPRTNLSPGGGEKAAGCWRRHSRSVSPEIEGCNGPATPKFTRKLQGSAILHYPGTGEASRPELAGMDGHLPKDESRKAPTSSIPPPSVTRRVFWLLGTRDRGRLRRTYPRRAHPRGGQLAVLLRDESVGHFCFSSWW